MKRSLSLLCLLLALAVFAAMAIASTSDSDGEKEGIDSTEATSEDAAAIEEQVLLDASGVKITAKELVNDIIWGDGVKVLIENSNDFNVNLSCDATIVNNYMITDLFYSQFAAGKSSNETMYFSSSELKAAGIENIGQIEFYFRATTESYDVVFEDQYAVLKTSNFESMDIEGDESGTELYNANGVRIVGKYVGEDSFWGASVLLYVENKSGRNVMISCDDMSINGFMITPIFSSQVYEGKMAIDNITILESDLEENGIASIEDIELKFRILDAKTYDVIDETDAITFTAN